MKKLMIAAAIVCAAVMANAATYSWNANSSYIYSINACDPDWASVAAGTPAYFAFVDAYSQSDLVADFAAGSIDMSKFASTSAMTPAGGVAQSEAFTANYTTAQQGYFVLFEDGHMFVSTEATAGYLATGTADVVFENQIDASDFDANPVKDAATGYAGAGWYQTAAVPEPTSGLLLLLGVAGLALKRKRA